MMVFLSNMPPLECEFQHWQDRLPSIAMMMIDDQLDYNVDVNGDYDDSNYVDMGVVMVIGNDGVLEQCASVLM